MRTTALVAVNVFRESGTNLVDVADRVLEEVNVISALPEMQGIKLFVMFSQAESVRV